MDRSFEIIICVLSKIGLVRVGKGNSICLIFIGINLVFPRNYFVPY